METKVSLKNAIYITDKMLELMSGKCDETRPDQYLALYDLTRKIRACMAALVPISEHDYLCVPVNLLYRCMITDLMTSLLISVVDDNNFHEIMHIMDIKFAQSYKKAILAETKVKCSLAPEKASAFESASLAYQEKQYDTFKDCLKSTKGKEWEIVSIPSYLINGVKFKGDVTSIYNVLLTYPEVKDIASIYEYYLIFSQSEHFSLKNRVFIYKQDFHEQYYNKVRGLIYLGEEYLYKKYITKGL